MLRKFPIPKTAKHYYLFTDAAIKAHCDYKAAKAGNEYSAYNLVTDLGKPFLETLKSKIPSGCIFVSPYAVEAIGDNAIPLLLSLQAAKTLGGISETDIVQMQRVFHTGADPMERLLLRPTFSGKVIKGKHYVLVDDVTNMGGYIGCIS